jgi:hypothetical protein
MDSMRRRSIEAQAEALLRDAGISGLPIDPIQMAQHLDLQVTAKPPSIKGASGWLIRAGEAYAIVYATYIDSVGFQHFSIAHEIGHYVLDGHAEHVFRSGNEHSSHAGFGAADEIEREADYFAACLLMPKHLCKPLISSRQDGMAAVVRLAETCQTSLTAAALRYAEIGDLPVGVIQCFAGKVEFCASYPLLKHVGWARPLARNQVVPADSATRRMAQDQQAILSCQEDSESCEAGDWFSGADRSAGLIEEVVGLGKFGRTLTILTLDPDIADGDEEADEGEQWEPPRFR